MLVRGDSEDTSGQLEGFQVRQSQVEDLLISAAFLTHMIRHGQIFTAFQKHVSEGQYMLMIYF